MNLLRKSLVPLVLLQLVGACSSGDPEHPGFVCTAEVRAGVSVTVTDGVSGQPLSGVTGELVGTDGYTETAGPSPGGQASSNTLAFAYERAGTYSLTLRRDGYLDWRLSDITVTRDPCHVQTVSLQAAMVPR
jgi:hypothetical protein